MMTLERILTAAVNSLSQGKRKPHCGQPATQNDAENVRFALGYAEPGYQDPVKGVLFANWNGFPTDFDRVLESAGYAIEWEDEWTECCDCGKAVRTSPDCYQWQPYYVFMNECEIVCLNCLDWPEYLESIEDDSDKAVVAECNPALYGYERLSDENEFENGFHPGQTDSPAKILAALHATGRHRIVFRLSDSSQFYVRFETWQRIEDEDTD
jgi:hypothetical protein